MNYQCVISSLGIVHSTDSSMWFTIFISCSTHFLTMQMFLVTTLCYVQIYWLSPLLNYIFAHSFTTMVASTKSITIITIRTTNSSCIIFHAAYLLYIFSCKTPSPFTHLFHWYLLVVLFSVCIVYILDKKLM